ncbi:hypothetical protein FB451DRAFT_1280752 [Mycena latifolia]|nr:hypothetical protein FB451DRAFT_1280752 [Mycena latifolia]
MVDANRMWSARSPDSGPDNEAYSAKLWSVYVSEAEKYDRALVETWRSNMDGMLIYAGLFSASLTAFLIESYKTLNPDPEKTTIFLLTQISHQLAAAANGSTFELPPPPDPFIPPTSSLVCNALWFISLGLSLSCALVATLLEQWARDFIHHSEIRSAPVIRARVFSYLYYGLKRFKMHTVVEIVPLLLHASLLLFFAGLVTFLAPVNSFIMTVVATSLGVVAAVYLALTLLPIAFLDCPYRTPLSGALWRVWHALPLHGWNSNSPNTGDGPHPVQLSQPNGIVEAIHQQATESCPERTVRDIRALVWTVKSLTDDEELEPFVESLSDVIWSLGGRRNTYDDYITALIHNPDVQLWARIEGLLRSCSSGLLSSEARTRRHLICYKALWSIASLGICPNDSSGTPDFLPDLSLVQRAATNNPDVEHYAVSTRALIRWRWFCAFKNKIFDAVQVLIQCKGHLSGGRRPNLHPVQMFFEKIQQHDNNPTDIESSSSLIDNILKSLYLFSTDIPFIIIFDYLRECASLDALPHQFQITLSTITPPNPCFSIAGQSHLKLVMHDIAYRHLDRLNTTAETHFVDQIIGTLNSIWQQGNIGNPIMPRGTIEYLNRRNSDSAVSSFLDRCDPSLLISAITVSLGGVPSPVIENPPDAQQTAASTGEALTALWRILTLSPPLPPSVYEAALRAIEMACPEGSHPAIICLIKTNILKTFSFKHCANGLRMTIDDIKLKLANPILPADTAFKIPAELLACPDAQIENGHLDALNQVLRDRITEARIQVLSELFESCGSSVIPDHAVETLPFIAHFEPPPSIHAMHQTRFANSIRAIFEHSRGHPELLKAVVNTKIFDVYAAGHDGRSKWRISGLVQKHPWLDNPEARQTVRRSLADYPATLLHDESPELVARIDSIIKGIDKLHREKLV